MAARETARQKREAGCTIQDAYTDSYKHLRRIAVTNVLRRDDRSSKACHGAMAPLKQKWSSLPRMTAQITLEHLQVLGDIIFTSALHRAFGMLSLLLLRLLSLLPLRLLSLLLFASTVAVTVTITVTVTVTITVAVTVTVQEIHHQFPSNAGGGTTANFQI